VEIAFFGGSFTGIDEELQNAYLSLAQEYVLAKKAHGIRISTRPDYISEAILQRLSSYGVTAIELGAQSMCDEVLFLSQRGHTAADTEKSAKLIQQFGFSLGLQMMVGLPGSSKMLDLETAQKIAALCPDTVRIYPVIVLKDTALARLYAKGEYAPLTLEETVERLVPIVRLFHKRKIKIIRIGLYQGTNPQNDGTYLAGPMHPALGELVESRILREDVARLLEGLEGPVHVIIRIHPGLVSKMIGQKRENMVYWQKRFPHLTVQIVQDRSLAAGEYRLEMA
jgi:histone acetyltransferase (RNA polymerase elongator complex component)